MRRVAITVVIFVALVAGLSAYSIVAWTFVFRWMEEGREFSIPMQAVAMTAGWWLAWGKFASLALLLAAFAGLVLLRPAKMVAPGGSQPPAASPGA